MPCTEARLEALSTELDAYGRAFAAANLKVTRETLAAEARAESRLLDAAIACGMSRDQPSVADWAAQRVVKWLCSGVSAEAA